MKTIDKMTEKQILALSEQEIVQMIKFRMASEGIKIMDEPTKPELHKIPEMDKVVYRCPLFGGHVVYEDVEELRDVLKSIKDASSSCSIDTDYISSSPNATTHIIGTMRNVGFSSDEWDSIQTVKVFSSKLFNEVNSAIKQNEAIENAYKEEFSSYTESQEGVSDIQNEIWDRVREVKDKYYNLDLHVSRFKTEYMPLAGDDEAIAMNFLSKAYSITDRDKEYILKNYKAKAE